MAHEGKIRLVVEVTFPDAEAAQLSGPELVAQFSRVATLAGAAVTSKEFSLVEQSPEESGARWNEIQINRDAEALETFERAVDPEVDLFAEDIQQRLDAPIADLLIGNNRTSLRIQMVRTIQDASLLTVCDILSAGVWAVRGYKGLTFGPKRVDELRTELARHIPEIPLLDEVPPTVTARFCRGLDQIPYPRPFSPRLTMAEILDAGSETAFTEYGIQEYEFEQIVGYAQRFRIAQLNQTFTEA